MNSFGTKFKFTSFGESHGAAVGGVLEGVPAGLLLDGDLISSEVAKRRGGGKFATPRKEEDLPEFLSGVFEGRFTGTPVGFVIKNATQHSKDYENLREIFRPSHADYTYFCKYGIRDHRGGGRASARETAVRVVAGAVAELILRQKGICVESALVGVGDVEVAEANLDFDFARESEIFFASRELEAAAKESIAQAREEGDSVGGVVLTRVRGVCAGLGEPLYDKLDGRIGGAFLGLNGVKAVEVGSGVRASKMRGSTHNDEMADGGFLTNHAGGILGGISTGAEILVRTHFKPTASIFREQRTLNLRGENVRFTLKGRHDPCIAVRGSVVLTAMMRCILADFLLQNFIIL